MSKSHGIEAIVFDYDGLLVDTENFWFEACQQVCAAYGVVVTEEYRLDLMRSGLSAYLIETFGLDDPIEIVRPRLHAAFQRMTGGSIDVMPGVDKALKTYGSQYQLAVGSGSHTRDVENGLIRLSLSNRFEVIVGSDQVDQGKPQPDIYLKVAELLQIQPSACVVFEDQPKGVKAAKAAGMICVAVPNKYLKNANYSQADRIITDLGQASLKLIRELEKW